MNITTRKVKTLCISAREADIIMTALTNALNSDRTTVPDPVRLSTKEDLVVHMSDEFDAECPAFMKRQAKVFFKV